MVCKKKGDEEQMLLCDSCNKAFHMYCLRPRILEVPAGDWFCYSCAVCAGIRVIVLLVLSTDISFMSGYIYSTVYSYVQGHLVLAVTYFTSYNIYRVYCTRILLCTHFMTG